MILSFVNKRELSGFEPRPCKIQSVVHDAATKAMGANQTRVRPFLSPEPPPRVPFETRVKSLMCPCMVNLTENDINTESNSKRKASLHTIGTQTYADGLMFEKV